MAMQVSAGMKPSSAHYDSRGTSDAAWVRGGAPGIAEARNADEHILALVEHQATVADQLLRKGEARRAVEILRRTLQITSRHSSPPEPVARLATASVQLQLCAVLSQIHLHEQAFAEAQGAKEQTDAMWKNMGEASEIAADADEVGDITRPAPHLRRLIRNPPAWVPRMAEVSIQARQAMAVEIEFLTGREHRNVEHSKGQEAQGTDRLDALVSPTLDEACALHEQAWRLAMQLLPEDAVVRVQTENVYKESLARTAKRHFRKASSPSKSVRNSPPSRTGKSAPLEIPELPSIFRLGPKQRIFKEDANNWPELASHPSTATTALPGGNSCTGWRTSSLFSSGESWNPSHSSSNNPVPTLKTVCGHPTAPRGDVRTHSLLRTTSAPVIGFKEQANDSIDVPDWQVDPFTDWKRSVEDVLKMSYRQLTLRTSEGPTKVKGELELMNRRFKSMELPAKPDDELYEYRMFYTGHGMAAWRKIQKRDKLWKASAWKPTALAQAKKAKEVEVFTQLGVRPMFLDSMTMTDLKKIYKKIQENSPEAVERRRREEEEMFKKEEERKRREMEERRSVLRASLVGNSSPPLEN